MRTIALLKISNVFMTFTWLWSSRIPFRVALESHRSEWGNCILRILLSGAGKPNWLL
jgi:uncharacterized protein (DUF486 family)